MARSAVVSCTDRRPSAWASDAIADRHIRADPRLEDVEVGNRLHLKSGVFLPVLLKIFARVWRVMSSVTVKVPWAPQPLACMRRSGITSRSKCAIFSISQISCSSAAFVARGGPAGPIDVAAEGRLQADANKAAVSGVAAGGRGNRLRLRHDGHGWRHFPRARYPDYELGGSAPRCSCDGRIQSSQFSCGAGWRLRDAQIPPARAPMVARRCGDRRPVRSDVWEPLLARECASLRARRNSRYFGLQANAIMTMLSLANPASSSSPFSFYEESTSF